MRMTHHLAVLALLGATILTGLGASWDEPQAAVVMAAPSPVPIVDASAPGVVTSLTTSPGSGGGSFVVAPIPTAAAPIAAAPTAEPARQWVENFRPTDLF